MRLALLAHALAVCSALQLQPSRPVLHASCAPPRTNGVFAGRKGRPSGQQLGMQGGQMGGPKGRLLHDKYVCYTLALHR